MPVEFVRQDENCKTSVCDSVKLVMAYDGSGRRISKTRLRRDLGASDWAVENVTHYTGIGTEVRETHVNGQDETKVVVNIPNGLGRYTPEDAVDGFNGVGASQRAGYRPPAKFEWYLKNHIGSTMLVYGTSAYNDPYASGYKGGVKAAYDYRAFGELVDLTEPTDKVTENFTGKEKDDETELNYFGARYLDPMLGMWTSVDPARQFSSPYLYVGNGYNPIVSIDEDGLWGFDVNVGVRGSVIVGGSISLRLSYDSEDPSKNKALFSIGFGVGMEIGLPLKGMIPNSKVAKVADATSKLSVNLPKENDAPETGWHSEVDIGLGANASFADGEASPSAFGFGTVGGGYYETFTIDVGKFLEDKKNDAMEIDYSDSNAD